MALADYKGGVVSKSWLSRTRAWVYRPLTSSSSSTSSLSTLSFVRDSNGSRSWCIYNDGMSTSRNYIHGNYLGKTIQRIFVTLKKFLPNIKLFSIFQLNIYYVCSRITFGFLAVKIQKIKKLGIFTFFKIIFCLIIFPNELAAKVI